MQKLEAKENTFCIDKDLESLRELVKKVKTEGVKEVIDRISTLFNASVVNKREQKTARVLIVDIDGKIKDSWRVIMGAIEKASNIRGGPDDRIAEVLSHINMRLNMQDAKLKELIISANNRKRPVSDDGEPHSAVTNQTNSKRPAMVRKTQPTETPPKSGHPKKEQWSEVKTKRALATKEGAASDPVTTRARPKVRPPAVLVKIATGSSYVDTVKAWVVLI